MRILFTIALLGLLPAVAFAQEPANQPEEKHRVGLIDMAHVFKNYKKFSAMTEALQKQIEESDQSAQKMLLDIQGIQQQLTSGVVKEGTPDFVQLESKMLKAQTDLETFRRTTQRDFLRKEAEIYKTVYVEVESFVKQYAGYYDYDLILRFNRERVLDAENPRDIMNGLNRQVVFFRQQNDITKPILNYINERWDKQQAVQPASATQPAN